MDKIRIIGGKPLSGSIPISGAKNAALPLMAAGLLTDEVLTLTNIPYLADVVTMAKLLTQHGVALTMIDVPSKPGEVKSGKVFSLSAKNVHQFTAPYDLVRTMRASVLVLGPLLARFGAANVSLPGGCAIGTRPIDLHLKALEQMGAHIELSGGYIKASVQGRLQGAAIHFEKVSVGATENLLMAASLAEGETVLYNAACEPEVTNLAECLMAMGAQISGLGTSTLKITGVDHLHAAEHAVIPDRIETGSFMAAVAAAGGEVELIGAKMHLLENVIAKFREAGVTVLETAQGIKVARHGNKLKGVDIMTEPYPHFPTDMQAQFMAMLALAEGASMISETIFENRFMHVPELARMGANITVHGGTALVRGVSGLRGAEVMATDLRASLSLVIAALAAEGETVLHRVYHLDRGYERLEEKLSACGAQIERINGCEMVALEEAA